MTSLANTQTKVFGAGNVVALVSGLTPVSIGTLQDIEIDISASVAELYGQNQFAEAVARGKGKITGKAKTGRFDVNLFNSLYYGGTVDNTGYRKTANNESHTAGASANTFAPTNVGSSSIVDLGLYYSATGVQLTVSTAAAPTIGNYAVASSGLYTVSTAETAATGFYANYDYLSSGTGNQLVVTNQLMGVQPVFSLELWEGYTDFTGRSNFAIKLNRCMANKMSFPFKNTDFMISDFEFEAFADSTGGLFTLGVGI